jgi:hypothetical protein
MAITFIMVGAVLLWNPLGRRPRPHTLTAMSPDLGPHAGVAHTAVSG